MRYNYVDLVTDLLRREISRNSFYNPDSRWEALKYEIRSFSINCSRCKAKERWEKENQLIAMIFSLEQK